MSEYSTGYALFNRRWAVTANDGEEERSWRDIDLEFKITKTGDTKPNEAEITLVNLNADSRKWIQRRNLVLMIGAGYESSSGMIFKGGTELINHEHSDTEWNSQVYGKDGGAALRDLTLFKTFAKDTPLTTVIEAVIKRLTDIPDGLAKQFQEINQLARQAIDLQSFKPKKAKPKSKKKSKKQKDIPPEEQQQAQHLAKKEDQREKADAKRLQRALTLRGAAISKLEALCRRAGLRCIITDQSLSVFPDGLSLSDDIVYLDRTSGLIGSPEQTEEGGFKFRSFLRHEFNPGLLVEVNSLYITGVYLIEKVEHTGNTRSNEWYTDLYCTEYA